MSLLFFQLKQYMYNTQSLWGVVMILDTVRQHLINNVLVVSRTLNYQKYLLV